jgi:L-asparaginase
MQKRSVLIGVLGTGGTIAGESESVDALGYRSAARPIAQLLEGFSAAGAQLESEQVAQLDSKDMNFATWHLLATRIAHHLARAEVAGLVVTHGTDTLEETAYFLQRVLAPAKPVVLTAAMRPATSRQADGPQNLRDAITLAGLTGASGVLVVVAGNVHGARDVRKVHPYRLDAFGSGDAGVLGRIEAGRLRLFRAWPAGAAFGLSRLPTASGAWPVVDIVTSHVGARARTVEALCDSGAHGIVVATTGNGTVHHELESALFAAQARGIAVVRSTRCLDGTIVEDDEADDDPERREPAADAAGEEPDENRSRLPSAGDLTPVKARIDLILRLIADAQARPI